MRLVYLLSFLWVTSLSTVYAQAPLRREIGLRSSVASPLNAGFIYKKQLTETKYRRYRLGFTSATINIQSPSSTNSFSLGTAIGTEFRKDLDDRLQFIYGPEFSASLSIATAGNFYNNTTSTYTLTSPQLGFGYVLGVQYNFNGKWYVNLEAIPSIAVRATYGYPDVAPIYTINADVDSFGVGLTGAYRF